MMRKKKNSMKIRIEKKIFERVWLSCLIWLLHDFCDKSVHHTFRNGCQFRQIIKQSISSQQMNANYKLTFVPSQMPKIFACICGQYCPVVCLLDIAKQCFVHLLSKLHYESLVCTEKYILFHQIHGFYQLINIHQSNQWFAGFLNVI